MFLEIISPEATIFSGEVLSVSVPGESGSFQMLNNHAPIVSSLKPGNILIEGDLKIKEEHKNKFKDQNGKTSFIVNSGTIEMNNNKLVILAD
tara:strand:- start:10218 stop:10493 length:276 start_codon:yes stop_codon:yes gene_type:complete